MAIVPTVSLLPNCRRLVDWLETAFWEVRATDTRYLLRNPLITTDGRLRERQVTLGAQRLRIVPEIRRLRNVSSLKI